MPPQLLDENREFGMQRCKIVKHESRHDFFLSQTWMALSGGHVIQKKAGHWKEN